MNDHQILITALIICSVAFLMLFCIGVALFKMALDNDKETKRLTSKKDIRPIVFLKGIEHIDILEEQFN